MSSGRIGPTLPSLPRFEKLGISHAIEELFGNPAYKGLTLQDKKRLPARFYARVAGALTSRLPLA